MRAAAQVVGIEAPGAADRHPLEAMLDRCSESTLFHRFHGGGRDAPARYVDRLLEDSDRRQVLLARVGPDVVGVAEAHRDGGGTAELAVLVEDSWQHRGVGSRLVAALAAEERRHGVDALRATVLGEDRWVVRLLGRLGPLSGQPATGTYEVQVPLNGGPDGRGALTRP
jgi:GNAT superfamily N-acetyltransferase